MAARPHMFQDALVASASAVGVAGDAYGGSRGDERILKHVRARRHKSSGRCSTNDRIFACFAMHTSKPSVESAIMVRARPSSIAIARMREMYSCLAAS